MFVIFCTRYGSEPGVFHDDYMVRETEEEARAALQRLIENPTTYAAGMGPIIDSTEHWHVP